MMEMQEGKAVISARVALADVEARRAAVAIGAADGLRRRADLKAWPSMRRREAELATRASQELDSRTFEDALEAGAALTQREAVVAVRRDSARDDR